MTFSKEYSYNNFLDSDIDEEDSFSGFYVFLQFLAAGLLIVISVYFLSVFYGILKRRGLLDWDI